MTAFEILARHFANKTDTRLIFRDKACPQTDGQTIILPKAMVETQVLPTIGALLHESAHIKYTNFEDTRRMSTDKVLHLLQNLLEDIRIDTKVFNKYDGARSLYRKLIKTAFTDNPEDFDVSKVTQNFIDVVRNIYVHALNMPEFYVGKDLFEQFLSDKIRKQALDEIISETKSARSTGQLEFNVKRLERMLKDFIKEIPKQPKGEGEGEPTEGEEGEGEGEGEGGDMPELRQIKIVKSKSGKGNKDGNKGITATVKDMAKEKKQEELKETKQEKAEAEKKQKEFKEKKDKLQEELSDAWNKRCKAKDPDKRQELKEETDDLQKKIKNLNTRERKEEKKARQLNNQEDDIEDAINEIDEAGDDDAVVDTMIETELDESHGVGKILIGFKALTESPAFKVVQDDIVDFESNMKAIFSRLEHITHYNNNTGRVNLKKIHKIFNGGETDYSDIFVYDKIKEESHNKVMFLLDGSGSMGNINSHKNQALCNCVYNLARVIDANKDTYNIQYEVAVFSDSVETVKKFDNGNMPATPEEFVEQINNARAGGGTEICRALEHCYAKLDEVATVKDRKFIIIFTDAEFASQDMDKILQEYNARPERVIFIGIQQKDDYYAINKRFYEEILMKRLVSTVGEMERTLIDGFDRLI